MVSSYWRQGASPSNLNGSLTLARHSLGSRYLRLSRPAVWACQSWWFQRLSKQKSLGRRCIWEVASLALLRLVAHQYPPRNERTGKTSKSAHKASCTSLHRSTCVLPPSSTQTHHAMTNKSPLTRQFRPTSDHTHPACIMILLEHIHQKQTKKNLWIKTYHPHPHPHPPSPR